MYIKIVLFWAERKDRWIWMRPEKENALILSHIIAGRARAHTHTRTPRFVVFMCLAIGKTRITKKKKHAKRYFQRIHMSAINYSRAPNSFADWTWRKKMVFEKLWVLLLGGGMWMEKKEADTDHHDL